MVKKEEREGGLIYINGMLHNLPLFAKELIAGGVAGGVAKSAVAPLERIKILFQIALYEDEATTETTHFEIEPFTILVCHGQASDGKYCLQSGTLGLLIVGKTALVTLVGKLFGVSTISAVRTGLLLAPGGEFAFVAFGEAVN